MRVNNFSVLIPEGREKDSGHVELKHNTVYTIRLGNHDSNRQCDAEVTVDGKNVGAFRVWAGGSMILERTSADTGRFTFYEANSQQAQDANAKSVTISDRGLIQVIFRPERRRERPVEISSLRSLQPQKTNGLGFVPQNSAAPANYSAGITGLTGHSEQQFVSVPNLDYEPNAEVTVNLRLVAIPAVRELTSVTQSNAVPAPVGI